MNLSLGIEYPDDIIAVIKRTRQEAIRRGRQNTEQFLLRMPVVVPSQGEQSLYYHGFEAIERFTKRYFREKEERWSKKRSGRDHLRFLYALTLFRQSRHASALCMDALCRCGSRFDTTGGDNDANRMEIISDWLRNSSESEFFGRSRVERFGWLETCVTIWRVSSPLWMTLNRVGRNNVMCPLRGIATGPD